MNGSLQAVFFDLDGTLVDSLPGIEYSAGVAWRSVGLAGGCPPLRPFLGPPIREIFRRLLPDADAATLNALHAAFRVDYDSKGWMKTEVYPGVLDTLSGLVADGVRCFGVTNKPSLSAQRILTHCGLRPYFSAFLSPDSRTPSFSSKAEAVLSLMSDNGLEPAGVLLVGDTADDGLAAQTCGVRFVAFAGGYGFQSLAPSLPVAFVCRQFTDLLELTRAERD